jgi:protoporphyrinogen oxidase
MVMILGGGVSGLAAGLTAHAPIFEAASVPGGICSSYYVRPGEQETLAQCPPDDEAYHFEVGGGHWIFGGDPTILNFIDNLTPLRRYQRASAVYFRERDLYVPYPLQNHLRLLDPSVRARALAEIASPQGPAATMKQWLERSFGRSLSELFFNPFHDLYTAGLSETIAPQDGYKSPVDVRLAIQGAFDGTPPVGYNSQFVYPLNGLNMLAQRMASQCDIRYGKQVESIGLEDRVVHFKDGTSERYTSLIATLPLNRLISMCDLRVEQKPDPYTSVLVLNIGAARGPKCPDDHWLYNPDAKSGFHRVGFYSNVDRMFLPKSARGSNDCVSIYVERAYLGGNRPGESEVAFYAKEVVQELQEWGYIGKTDVVHPTWIDVAYTWSWPGSRWREEAMGLLESRQVFPVGRYARWVFQGIADSIRDGFYAGSALRRLS